VRSILRPGLYYCDSIPSCSTVDLTVILSDGGAIAFGVVIYFIIAIVAGLILSGSGAWSPHSFRNKVVCLFSLTAIFWSIVQLSATAAQRGYVIPYSSVQEYNFTISLVNSTAVLDIDNIYSSYYDNLNSMIEIVQAQHPSSTPQSNPPAAHVLYSDNWDEAYKVTPGFSRMKEIQNLEQNQGYLFILRPAKKAGDKAVHAKDRVEYSPETNKSRIYVDLRAFRYCKWDKDIGCIL
jgi:hypothetical protein